MNDMVLTFIESFIRWFSWIVTPDALGSMFHDFLQSYDFTVSLMSFSDLLGCVVYFGIVFFAIYLVVKFFVGCLRKFWEVIVG